MTPSVIAVLSLEDWWKLIGAATGFGGLVFTIVQWIVSRSEKRIIESRGAGIEGEFLAMLKDTLKFQAERAGHGHTRVIDITFISSYGPDVEIRIPVIMKQWVLVRPGIQIMGEEFARDRTTYLLQINSTARIKDHRHRGVESVLTIKGVMRDLTADRSYYPSEMWTIPAGEIHSVHFEAPRDASSHGLFLITVRPALPSTAEVSLSLEGMSELA